MYNFKIGDREVIRNDNFQASIILSHISNNKRFIQPHFIFTIAFYHANCLFLILFTYP